ncbi:MAG TPA: ATP-binding protein, partial [Gemmatimonadales bacterium]|nr:ATP-binding protein [Gemmatimonadales bacterium]
TPEGGVGLRARRAQAGIEVVVHDSGIGLTREEQAKLFTKFFRSRNPVVTDTGGTGLGLVIAKAIVERHNGRIEVASIPGEGTHVRVVLPVPSAG